MNEYLLRFYYQLILNGYDTRDDTLFVMIVCESLPAPCHKLYNKNSDND